MYTASAPTIVAAAAHSSKEICHFVLGSPPFRLERVMQSCTQPRFVPGLTDCGINAIVSHEAGLKVWHHSNTEIKA